MNDIIEFQKIFFIFFPDCNSNLQYQKEQRIDNLQESSTSGIVFFIYYITVLLSYFYHIRKDKLKK